MMLVLRRTNTIFTLAAELAILGKIPIKRVSAACAVIVAGSLVAGWRDLTFSLEGYALIFLQNCATTGQTISTTYVNQRFNFPSLSMMFCMALLSFPFHCIWAAFSDCHIPFAPVQFEV